jgi:hypothetical protein
MAVIAVFVFVKCGYMKYASFLANHLQKSKPMAVLLPSLSLSGHIRNVFGILYMTANTDGICQGANVSCLEAQKPPHYIQESERASANQKFLEIFSHSINGATC